jgi:hypothetical protein
MEQVATGHSLVKLMELDLQAVKLMELEHFLGRVNGVGWPQGPRSAYILGSAKTNRLSGYRGTGQPIAANIDMALQCEQHPGQTDVQRSSEAIKATQRTAGGTGNTRGAGQPTAANIGACNRGRHRADEAMQRSSEASGHEHTCGNMAAARIHRVARLTQTCTAVGLHIRHACSYLGARRACNRTRQGVNTPAQRAWQLVAFICSALRASLPHAM